MDGARGSRVGALLREWRRRRRLSQLELSLLAETSTRHLSCVETGKARPSREMVLRLADALDVPLRERNSLLLAADYAPAYRESEWEDQELTQIRAALDQMLAAHEPYPAVVLDRYWNVRVANRAMRSLLADVPPRLHEPTPNVFRLVLHPEGLAARLVNLAEARGHFLGYLGRQVDGTGDPRLRALLEEVRSYPRPEGHREDGAFLPSAVPIQVPLRVRSPLGELALFGTMATFGAPADVTLSELAIELFYPLDERTADALRRAAAEAVG
ncbi:helix-turn-helix domain-containing protein [Streptomyces triticirhizae]|uniref:XRE family transcriptional regulator n=1 Tax=Streptomyces triticirhizae TaxID=2483353 RepID=A0A3M2M9U9_9ACTN|nr:helix-turn-helix transcriptional regulator [Streptomyces triticirhizae]RMI46249.1 XRE family transcriptional regulator [Streptomyces triticirhizae]